MYEVLAFVYNHFDSDACPELLSLHRTLHWCGFSPDDINDALLWLEGLKAETSGAGTPTLPPSASTHPTVAPAMRLLTPAELVPLGPEGWGYLTWLTAVGALSTTQRERVIERAMATGREPLDRQQLKLMVLMVFWGQGHKPDALLMGELCSASPARWLH